MQVACFELDDPHGPGLVAPSLAVVGTHDLPPLPSFYRGDDLRLRHALDLMSDDELAAALAERERLRTRWVEQLVAAEHLPPDADAESVDACEVLEATHRLLLASPSRLVALSLADLCGEERPVNLPGTTAEDGSESWCTRYAQTLDAMLEDDALAASLRACTAARSG